MRRVVFLFLAVLILPCNTACGEKKKDNAAERVRPAAVAGGFYPGNPKRLSQDIENFLSQADQEKLGTPVIGLIAPHAGYVYSGSVAAWAYKTVQGRAFDLVIVAGTSHSYRYRGVSIYDGDAYATPLGEVPIDRELAGKLVEANPLIQWNAKAYGVGGGTVHDPEHSLEVQLPFLQKVLTKKFKFIPLLFGSQDLSVCQKVADTLAAILKKENKKVLLVASTDLTHFPTYDDANQIDPLTLNHIAAMQIGPLAKYFDTYNLRKTPNLATLACGRAGIYLTLLTAQKLGAKHGKVIKYANSADVPIGDKYRVVGYGAVAFY
jgi:AmmeMemoRadiSam system protein B